MKRLPRSTVRFVMASGLSLVSLLTLANCGAGAAVDATKSMPDKIDATNAQVTNTNSKMDTMVDQVKKTNDGMTTMVGAVKQTNDGITKTNAAVHNQTLAVALSTMLSKENTRFLQPATDMMPAGQVFANEASADEIAQLTWTMMTGISTHVPDSTKQVTKGSLKPAGAAAASDDTDMVFPDTYITEFDHMKLAQLTAIEIIAGLMPQEKVEQLVHDQIDNGGQYESTAYQILALRYDFILGQLLGGATLTQPLVNPGLAEDAVAKAQQMTWILSMPYVDKLQVNVTGMLKDDDNRSIVVKPTAIWKVINRSLQADMDPKYAGTKSVSDLKTEVTKHIPPKPTPAAAPAQ